MSGAGHPTLEALDGSGLTGRVVAASWHETVMDGLIAGHERALADCKVESPVVVRAPGSFELPVRRDRPGQPATTRWSRSASSIRGGHRTSSTSATR